MLLALSSLRLVCRRVVTLRTTTAVVVVIVVDGGGSGAGINFNITKGATLVAFRNS